MAAKIRIVENTKGCRLVIGVNLLEAEDHDMKLHKDEEAKVVEMPKLPETDKKEDDH